LGVKTTPQISGVVNTHNLTQLESVAYRGKVALGERGASQVQLAKPRVLMAKFATSVVPSHRSFSPSVSYKSKRFFPKILPQPFLKFQNEWIKKVSAH